MGQVDATIRRDGRCRQCKGVRPDAAVIEKDPFCTAACCREFYGVELSYPEKPEAARKRTMKSTPVIHGRR